MKHTDIIKSLSLEQKCALLSGGTVFTTRALPGKGIPAITLSGQHQADFPTCTTTSQIFMKHVMYQV